MSLLLAVLASLYGWAASARCKAYQLGWLKTRRLSKPVISVGNLTTGGTGKTPLVALLADALLKLGLKPAILTRGYGRARGPKLAAIAPDPLRSPDPRKVGDEPALLAAMLPQVPIVVCADRWRAGRYAEENYEVDVHLLDDGLQHLRLAREMNLVVLDATQPLSDRAIIPAGRQRERLSALRRADVFVITRSGDTDVSCLERQAHEANPRAPLFHAHTRLCGWRDLRSGARLSPGELIGRRVYAFCGTGNPHAFFRDLERWGLEVSGAVAFRDHHVYASGDLARVARCAKETGAALVTTEKDVMNLPPGWEPPVTIFSCLVEMEILEEEAFEAVLSALP